MDWKEKCTINATGKALNIDNKARLQTRKKKIGSSTGLTEACTFQKSSELLTVPNVMQKIPKQSPLVIILDEGCIHKCTLLVEAPPNMCVAR